MSQGPCDQVIDALDKTRKELDAALAQVAALREALEKCRAAFSSTHFPVGSCSDAWLLIAEGVEATCERALSQPAPAALDALKREVAERVREALKARVHGTNTNHSATYCALKEPMRGIAYAVAHELERYWVEQIDALDLTALLAEARP